ERETEGRRATETARRRDVGLDLHAQVIRVDAEIARRQRDGTFDPRIARRHPFAADPQGHLQAAIDRRGNRRLANDDTALAEARALPRRRARRAAAHASSREPSRSPVPFDVPVLRPWSSMWPR